VREDDWRGDSVDLSPDELGAVGGEQTVIVRQLDPVRSRSASGGATPTGGALPVLWISTKSVTKRIVAPRRRRRGAPGRR
jgi:hypothetical protein